MALVRASLRESDRDQHGGTLLLPRGYVVGVGGGAVVGKLGPDAALHSGAARACMRALRSHLFQRQLVPLRLYRRGGLAGATSDLADARGA
eukprot:5573025-Pleurochrysis_carterae.AAC.1